MQGKISYKLQTHNTVNRVNNANLIITMNILEGLSFNLIITIALLVEGELWLV